MQISLKFGELQKIMLAGLIVRLVILSIVLFNSETVSIGFLGNSMISDDVRYEAGAEIYSRTATSLVDREAYRNAYMSVGDGAIRNTEGIFSSTPLWYWICSGLYYVFKTNIPIRLLNVILGILSIKYVYLFAIELINNRVALISARMMAYLPYPVFFSCFAYKDQLLTFITFYIFYRAARFRNTDRFNAKEIFCLAVSVLALFLLRSGLSIILVMIAVIIGISNERGEVIRNIIRKNRTGIIIVAVLGVLAGGAILYRNIGVLLYKIAHYQMRYTFNEVSQASINFAIIRGPSQIWKGPIDFLLSIFLPIGRYSQYESWYGVVASLNYISIPIAIGNLIYVFQKKFDKIAYWLIIAVYVISAISSINICRHFYSLLPICYVSYADFVTNANINKKMMLSFGSLALFAVLVWHYFF